MLAVLAVSSVAFLAGATAALLVRTYAGTSWATPTRLSGWVAARSPAAPAVLLTAWAGILTVAAWLAGLALGVVTDGGSVGLVDWFAANRTPALTTVLAAATWLGDSSFVLPVVAVVGVAWRWRRGHWWALRLLFVAYLGSAAIYNAGKYLVGTARPVGEVVVSVASGAAFPSGHAANATVLYLGLLLVALTTERGRRCDVPLAFTCGALIAVVSLSRVYLGVHWLPDVIGGTALGGAWFTAVATVDGDPTAVGVRRGEVAGDGSDEAGPPEGEDDIESWRGDSNP